MFLLRFNGNAVDCSLAFFFPQLLNPIAWPVTYVNNSLIMLSDLETTSPEAPDVCGKPAHVMYLTLGINIYGKIVDVTLSLVPVTSEH